MYRALDIPGFTSFESDLYLGLMTLRRSLKLPGLQADGRLLALARWRAAILAATRPKDLSEVSDGHHTLTSWSQIPGAALNVAELLSVGRDAADDAITAWMNSPTHRANIEHPEAGWVGVAAQCDPMRRRWFVVLLGWEPKHDGGRRQVVNPFPGVLVAPSP